MYTNTSKEIYQALKQAVILHPKTGLAKCQIPQTFAVVGNSFLNTENLGKNICDKDKPYFFSAKWRDAAYNASEVSFDWPAVIAYESSYTRKKDRHIHGAKIHNYTTCYNIQLMVLDQKLEDCNEHCQDRCKGRTDNEIFEDTEVILNNILTYMDRLRYMGLPNGQVKLLDPNLYPDLELTHVGLDLPTELTFYRHESKSTSHLYGTSVTLSFCVTNCVDVEFETEGIDVKAIMDSCVCHQ